MTRLALLCLLLASPASAAVVWSSGGPVTPLEREAGPPHSYTRASSPFEQHDDHCGEGHECGSITRRPGGLPECSDGRIRIKVADNHYACVLDMPPKVPPPPTPTVQKADRPDWSCPPEGQRPGAYYRAELADVFAQDRERGRRIKGQFMSLFSSVNGPGQRCGREIVSVPPGPPVEPPAPVPLPAGLPLYLAALAGLVWWRRR